MCGLRRGLLLTGLAIAGLFATSVVRAEQIGDAKITVSSVTKGTSTSKADVVIVNKTGKKVPVTADSVALPLAINDELPLQIKPGTKQVKIVEYRWSTRGNDTQGWVMKNTKTIDVGLGLRGKAAKYIVNKAGTR